MSEKKVTASKVEAALVELKSTLQKGDAFAKVETKSGVGGAPQVFHTASNSEPGSWAGSVKKEASEEDGIAENATDYAGAVMKSILDAYAAGTLSAKKAQELLKGLPFGKDKDEDKDDDKDDKKVVEKGFDKDEEEKVEKSFEDTLASDEAVQKGFEVSDFLAGLATGISKSFAKLQSDLVAHIDARLGAVEAGQKGFNKSLTDAIVQFAEASVAQEARIAQVESLPAHAPKSVGYVAKSFAGGVDGQDKKLPKSEILKSLVDMVELGKASAGETIKFETGDVISDELYARVVAHRAGK